MECQACAALKCALSAKNAARANSCIKNSFVACSLGIPPDKIKLPKIPDQKPLPKL